MVERGNQMKDMLDFDQLQHEQKEWSDHNFPTSEPFEALLKVGEEVGELMSAFIHPYQRVRLTENWSEREKDAIGDIIISLAGYCNLQGIDMQKAIEDTWSEVKQRDWIKYPGDGRAF